jgi:hypothetical protein
LSGAIAVASLDSGAPTLVISDTKMLRVPGAAAKTIPVPPHESTPTVYNLPPGTRLMSGTLDTPWELIAPTAMEDNFSFENIKGLEREMKPITRPRFLACVENYVPPEAIRAEGSFNGIMVLDIQSSSEGYEIVDATLGDSNFADATLEACLRSVYKGVRAPLKTAEPNRRIRLRYPVVFGFRKDSSPKNRKTPSSAPDEE